MIILINLIIIPDYFLPKPVGLSYKRLNRQIVIGLLYVMLTIASAVLPMVTNLWLLYLCGFLFGFGGSAYVSGQVVWLMDMWGSSARPFLQLSDFCFAVGSLLSTIIIKPYLVGDLSTDVLTNGTSSFNQDYKTFGEGNDPNDIDRRSRLIWPVLIIGLCILSGKFLFQTISLILINFIRDY